MTPNKEKREGREEAPRKLQMGELGSKRGKVADQRRSMFKLRGAKKCEKPAVTPGHWQAV